MWYSGRICCLDCNSLDCGLEKTNKQTNPIARQTTTIVKTNNHQSMIGRFTKYRQKTTGVRPEIDP